MGVDLEGVELGREVVGVWEGGAGQREEEL